MLLIVPYGIETASSTKWRQAVIVLLIVPYGIETHIPVLHAGAESLLIVPYGIETFFLSVS